MIGEWTRRWASERGIPSWYFPETESTNKVAKDFPEPSGIGEAYLFVTDHQTGGYGRNHSTWIDPEEGDGLLCSWAFQVSSSPQPVFSPMVGLALFKAAMATWPSRPWALKAPNDLFLQDKKVAGILIENVQHAEVHRLVIGIGLNVLSHPGEVVEAGHIGEVDEEKWFEFLDALWNELRNAVNRCGEKEMSDRACTDLLGALNRWTLLKEPYQAVKPQGDLISPSGCRSWHSI